MEVGFAIVDLPDLESLDDLPSPDVLEQLDWVIASHELWGNYREVPSCQIYTMRRRPPALGVHTQPTRWNGRALVAGAEG